MSGRSSRSTFTAMKLSFTICATSGSSYDSRSITWHQWHQTAPMSSSMGLFSRWAAAKASSPHSCQRMGWCIAERRYAEDAWARELSEFDAMMLISVICFGSEATSSQVYPCYSEFISTAGDSDGSGWKVAGYCSALTSRAVGDCNHCDYWVASISRPQS